MTTWMRTTMERARADRRRDDAGFSLMETLVATSIFAIFMSLVMAAIISMLTSTQKQQSLTDGASHLENAFQKLDHQIRYADGISTPGTVGSNWYVEWRSSSTSTVPQTCTQLKLDTTADTLLERSWVPSATPVTPTAWYLLANNIVNAFPAQAPFFYQASNVTATGGTYAHQQLTVVLLAQPNGATKSRSTQSTTSVNFTALNSNSKSGVVCQEVARS